jgi:hypothetical protein
MCLYYLVLAELSSSFLSLALACARWTGACRPAGWQGAGCPGLARDGMGVSEVELDGLHEKSKRSCPPRVSKTTLPQPGTVTHVRYLSSMWEAAGSREGVGVVAVAGPSQVFELLLAPLSRIVAGWRAKRPHFA